jgi:hypothetical protein
VYCSQGKDVALISIMFALQSLAWMTRYKVYTKSLAKSGDTLRKTVVDEVDEEI